MPEAAKTITDANPCAHRYFRIDQNGDTCSHRHADSDHDTQFVTLDPFGVLGGGVCDGSLSPG